MLPRARIDSDYHWGDVDAGVGDVVDDGATGVVLAGASVSAGADATGPAGAGARALGSTGTAVMGALRAGFVVADVAAGSDSGAVFAVVGILVAGVAGA